MKRKQLWVVLFVSTIISTTLVFGSQTQFAKHLFEMIGLKGSETPQAIIKADVPDSVLYATAFRLIQSYEREASKQRKLGNYKRADFRSRRWLEETRLNEQQLLILKQVASELVVKSDLIQMKADDFTKAKRENSQDYSIELEKLKNDYFQLGIVQKEKLKAIFGVPDFEKFDAFVREKLKPRMTYFYDTQQNSFFLGYSEIAYDQNTREISGYSYTGGASLVGCDPEEGYCVINVVDAVLSSDQEGQIDHQYEESCGGGAEVSFYQDGANFSDTYCINGEHASYFSASYCDYQSGEGGASGDCVTTPSLPNVIGVGFQTIAANSLPIDDNPNIGDGLRIFPDDNTPGDMENRRRIRVTAQISEQSAGVTVFFRNFDLDDPSTDTTIDPNGNTENDNNGDVNGSSAGQLSVMSAVTNSQGIATADFTVTMQPGDNFAIAASTNNTELGAVTVNGTDLRTGSGASIDITCDGTDAVCRSEMLTVWRRLYIEADSMGEVQNNFVDGTFAGNYVIGTSDTIIQVNPQSLETGRFEGGRLVSGSTILQVITNTANTLTVRSSLGMVTVNQDDSFRLYDDDDFNDDDAGALNGDTGDEIPRPDTSLISISDDETFNVFAPAYIRPAQRPTGGKNVDVPFAANTGETEITNLFNTYFDNQATEADVEFWTIYLLGGYQFRTDRDGDPYTLVRGNLTTVWGAADTGERQTVGRGAILFTEDGRAREYPSDWASRPVSRAHTVAHEVGHLFGCIHADGGLMADTTRRTSGSLPPPCLNQIRRNATNP